MTRMGRVVLPNYPHHVVQRGHNRQVVFAEEGDFQRCRDDLRALKAAFDVKGYACRKSGIYQSSTGGRGGQA